MRLRFKPFDGRSWNSVDVVDEEANRVVGYIKSKSSCLSGIRVSLFDEKYVTTASRYEECLGFVNGVQAVLNHMIASEYIPSADTIPIPKTERIERRF
jgi:hypothetical protein